MSIRSYQDLKKNTPSGAAYVVDTSFLVRALHPNSEEFHLKEHLVKRDVLLAYNVTVRHEILHNLRPLLFEAVLKRDSSRFAPGVLKFWNENLPRIDCRGNEALKQLTRNGYVDLFKEVFGETGAALAAEEMKALAGCTYVSTDDFPVKLEWGKMISMMAIYGLDSSDAMILNFAASNASYLGIISADNDFMYCADDLEIVLPKRPNVPPCKPCKAQAV